MVRHLRAKLRQGAGGGGGVKGPVPASPPRDKTPLQGYQMVCKATKTLSSQKWLKGAHPTLPQMDLRPETLLQLKCKKKKTKRFTFFRPTKKGGPFL